MAAIEGIIPEYLRLAGFEQLTAHQDVMRVRSLRQLGGDRQIQPHAAVQQRLRDMVVLVEVVGVAMRVGEHQRPGDEEFADDAHRGIDGQRGEECHERPPLPYTRGIEPYAPQRGAGSPQRDQ